MFSSEVNEAVFINAPQMIFGRFENVLRNNAPQYPVVKSDVIPDEVYRAVESILYDNYSIPFSLLSFSFAASTFIFERRIVIRISNTNGNHKYIT